MPVLSGALRAPPAACCLRARPQVLNDSDPEGQEAVWASLSVPPAMGAAGPGGAEAGLREEDFPGGL